MIVVGTFILVYPVDCDDTISLKCNVCYSVTAAPQVPSIRGCSREPVGGEVPVPPRRHSPTLHSTPVPALRRLH